MRKNFVNWPNVLTAFLLLMEWNKLSQFSVRCDITPSTSRSSSSSSSLATTISTTMPAEFPAITYAAASNEPLLEKSSKQQQQTPLIPPAAFQQFKNSSLYLGLLVGFFIQASTLGANYLVISVSGEDAMTTSKHNIVLFSLFWSLFTSSLAIIILAFLRNLVRATYETDEDNNEDDSRNDQLDDMILHMECRFCLLYTSPSPRD